MSLAKSETGGAVRGDEPELTLRGPARQVLHELVHAMGQPLTILQMGRVLASKGGADADYGQVLGEVAGQVDSLTEMYRALRMLIEASEAEAEEMEVAGMLRRMEVMWGRRAARQGGVLRMDVDTMASGVFAGVGVEQALDRIFEGVLHGDVAPARAAALAGDADGPRTEVRVLGDGLEVVFCADGRDVVFAETWTLRVARALIEGGGGGVAYSGHPVCARVQFARA